MKSNTKSKTRKQVKIKNKKTITFKSFLNKNKIYFETIMTVALTAMAIVISIVSVSLEKKSFDLQEQEAAINEQLNMPVFNVSTHWFENGYTFNDITYTSGKEYQIINNGGTLTNGRVHATTKLVITIYDHNYKEIIANIIIEDEGAFDKNYSYFDSTTNSFTIIKEYGPDDITRNFTLRSFLEEQINNDYNFYDFSILLSDYVDIQYYDFKNDYHNNWYLLTDGELIETSINTPICNAYIDFDFKTNTEIYNIIKEHLDNALNSA